MRPMFYRLDGQTPVPVADAVEWGNWLETADRVVCRDELTNGWMVSTVFLGLDHGDPGPALLFETMIFTPQGLDDHTRRYTTWAEAEAGHTEMVALAILLSALKPN